MLLGSGRVGKLAAIPIGGITEGYLQQILAAQAVRPRAQRPKVSA
jgi:hypothetical protein